MSGSGREINAGAMHLQVQPAPSDDEAAAIVAAMRMLDRSRQNVVANEESGWRIAARREGVHQPLDPGEGGWRIASRLDL